MSEDMFDATGQGRHAIRPHRSATYSRLALIGLAAGAAIFAMLLAGRLIYSQGEAVAEADPAAKTVDVLVAAADIPAGQNVAAGSIRWQSWLKGSLGPNLITRAASPRAIEETAGALARTPIYAGEPVIATKLVKNHRGGLMALQLPSGNRAVSVKISPETGAGGFVLPDDHVDVILTRAQKAPDGGAESFVGETILRNVRVLAIDQTTETNAEGKTVAVGKTATIEVSPSQAETLAASEALGRLSLALRSHADREGAERADSRGPSHVVFVHRGSEKAISTQRYIVPGRASAAWPSSRRGTPRLSGLAE